MSLVLADRVQETTTTVGTGTLALDGAVQGFQSFAAVGNGNTTYYTIQGTTQWEVGIGTYSTNTLTRDTVISSSLGGAKLSLAAGTKQVFVTLPAEKTVIVPTSSTNHAVVRYDGTTGTVIQNSSVTVDDTGNVAGVKSQAFTGVAPTSPAIGTLWFDSSNDGWNATMNNITMQIGEEMFVYGRASNNIVDGQVIVVTGAWGTTGVVTFEPAPIGTTNADLIIGMATEPITKNSFGRITAFGTVHGLNTAALGDGNAIYYDPTVVGGYTTTLPSAPNLKMQVGVVTKAAGGTNGSIQINVIHGENLSGLSDVQITTPTGGQLLTYNQTSGYWKNTSLTAGSGISVTPAAGGGLTIANTSPSSGGTVTSVGGTGTVSGLTLTGTVTGSGNLTLGGAITGFAASGANTDITSVALTTGTISTAPAAATDIVNKTYADGLAAKWGA
jgi:hypothetical protein